MKRFLFATLLCAIGYCALGADTDGDGRLDLVDVPGFNPSASGDLDFYVRGIQDLDGANLLANATGLNLTSNQITSLENGDFQGLSNLQWLGLWSNQITSLDNGDFQGLSNLQELFLFDNQITTLENGDFQGLNNLQSLDLSFNQITGLENGAFQGLSKLNSLNLTDNNITELNLTNATFASLRRCIEGNGFCVDTQEITDLILDDALLSQASFQLIQGSFQVIVGQTQFISKVSLVGLAFSDGNPANLSALLDISTLDNVHVDQALFDRYAAEFNAFDAIPGNTVTVVPEPALPGDFNSDGSVDAADYVVWRKELGTSYTQNDYDTWRANFGQTAGSGAAGYPLGAFAEPLSVVAPEPPGLLLLIAGAALTGFRRQI